ncbi:MAG: TonB family protein [Acidipila sp.]|nr:TonB family protein [Acidipila sp.]
MQSRLPVSSLTCVELGEANGGIVIDISEGGLALTTAMGVPTESLTRMRIQVPKSREWIDVNGQIRWKSESRRKAGFRFVDLSERDRKRIEKWIFQESSPQGNAEQTAAVIGEARQSSREVPPPSSDSLMPGLATPSVAGERQTKDSNPSADSLAGWPSIEKFIPKLPPPQRETVPDGQEHAEEQISISDQRLYERHGVKGLAFMELGECNGGVILDISEGGVSVCAAVTLTDDYLPHMRFQLPPNKQWIEASGRVVRLDEAKTLAGIEFIDLSPEASMRISEWVASEASADESPSGRTEAYNKTARLLEILTVLAPEKTIPGSVPAAMSGTASPEKIIPSAEEVPVPAPQMAPVLLEARAPVIVPPAALPIRKPMPKTNFESSASPVRAQTSPAVGRPSWRTLAISVSLATLLSFAGAWIVAQRAAREQVLRMMGNAPAGKAEPEYAKQPPPPLTSSSAPALPAEIPRPPAKSATSASGSAVTGVSNTSLATASAQREAAVLSARSRVMSAPGTESKNPLPQGNGVKSPASTIATTAPARPPEPPLAQDLGSKSPLAKEMRSASSNSIASQPADSPKAGADAKQASLPAAQLPVDAEISKGAVSVSYSPYPSIRIPPELKSQTSRLGTSLRIGQLLSRVDPVYPEDAERQKIEGTVKLHVIIDREGAVQSVQVINGPSSLAPAAASALRQWRYKQTLFGGQPIETEEDVTVVFRMTKLPS